MSPNWSHSALIRGERQSKLGVSPNNICFASTPTRCWCKEVNRFASSLRSICYTQALDFLKPRLMQPCTAVAVPLHHRIFFIRPLHCTQLSRRLPEIAESLDAISGVYL
jgi:hypothetical protein